MNKKYVLLSMLLFLSAPQGYAEPADPATFEMPELVVTATKTRMDVKEVPSSIEVITQQDIQSLGAHSLKDVIGSIAGVGITRANGRESLSIRGFDARYSMILIDGRRIPAEPEPVYELDRLSLLNVDRIEIVRGPVSSLYGADALGGVVNIITKSADSHSLSLELDQGILSRTGDQNKRYSVAYDSGQQGKYNLHFSGSYNDYSPSTKSNGTTYSPFGQRKYVNSRIDYYPTSQEAVTFSSSYMRENTREYSLLQTPAGSIPASVHDTNDRSDYSLSYRKTLSDGEIYFNTYHSIWDKYNDTVNRTSGLYMNSIYGYYTISGVEARITKQTGDNHQLTLGSEFRPELFRGTGIQTGKGTFVKTYHGKQYTGSEVKTNYSALYLQDQWNLSPKLLVITSARYDDSDKFDSNISPKIGLTYTPRTDLRIKFNASQGFRVPSPNQLYLNLNVTRNNQLVNLVGNPNLKPEESTSYDLSVERDFGTIKSKLTFFTSKITDMIDEVWVNSSKVEYQNINKATIQGIESDISVPLSKNLLWSGNYTYLDARNDLTDSRLYNRARHKISSRLTYRPENKWSATLWSDSYIHYWFQPTAATSTNKSYTLWNVNAQTKLSENHFLQIGIDNFFDHRDDSLSLPGAIVHMNLKIKL